LASYHQASRGRDGIDSILEPLSGIFRALNYLGISDGAEVLPES